MTCDDAHLPNATLPHAAVTEAAGDDFRLPAISAGDVLRGAPGGVRLLDVRKAAARAASRQGLDGAAWIDPLTLGFGHPVLAAGPLAFFCVHGHEVSRFATALALVAGCEARYVRGGFAALAAAGAPLTPLPEPAPVADTEGRR